MSRKFIDKVINNSSLSRSELKLSFDYALAEILKLKDLKLFKQLITAFAKAEEWKQLNGNKSEKTDGVAGDKSALQRYDIITDGETTRQVDNDDS